MKRLSERTVEMIINEKNKGFLKELDPTKLHPEIMKMGYAMQDVSDGLHKFGVDVEKTKPQPSHLYEDGGFAKKHLLSVNGWLLPAKKETVRCFITPLHSFFNHIQ